MGNPVVIPGIQRAQIGRIHAQIGRIHAQIGRIHADVDPHPADTENRLQPLQHLHEKNKKLRGELNSSVWWSGLTRASRTVFIFGTFWAQPQRLSPNSPANRSGLDSVYAEWPGCPDLGGPGGQQGAERER
eukprot:1190666-Prorocentrum_minimum.AAC.1